MYRERVVCDYLSLWGIIKQLTSGCGGVTNESHKDHQLN